MAKDINSVTIVGRLTKDAELKYTNSGTAISNLSIAVNRSKKVGDAWEEEANFFDVSLWGRRGESLNQYLQKGTRIAVTGELKQDRWEQDGQKRSRVIIHANDIQLLGGNKQENQGNNSSNYQNNNIGNSKPSNNYSQNQGQANNGNFEDDIPF